MVLHVTKPKSIIYIDAKLKENFYNTTPEYIHDILTQTNHYANIKRILKQIIHPSKTDTNNNANENPIELRKIAKQYKEVLLEMVDAREHIPNNLEIIKKIAHAGGYLKELETLDAKPKIYGHLNKVLYATSRSDVQRDLSPFDTIIVDTNQEDFFISSADNIKRFHILKAFNITFIKSNLTDATINVPSTTNLTYHSSHIDLSHLELPANSITLEASTNVSDKRNQDTIKFQARNITLNSTSSLRKEVLDFSQTEKVTISDSLYNVKKLIFMPNSVVTLNYCRNFPKTMDFSMCKDVFLYRADLSNVSEIIFEDENQRDSCLDGAIIDNNLKCKFTKPIVNPIIYNLPTL